jgi:hypothetical protein
MPVQAAVITAAQSIWDTHEQRCRHSEQSIGSTRTGSQTGEGMSEENGAGAAIEATHDHTIPAPAAVDTDFALRDGTADVAAAQKQVLARCYRVWCEAFNAAGVVYTADIRQDDTPAQRLEWLSRVVLTECVSMFCDGLPPGREDLGIYTRSYAKGRAVWGDTEAAQTKAHLDEAFARDERSRTPIGVTTKERESREVIVALATELPSNSDSSKLLNVLLQNERTANGNYADPMDRDGPGIPAPLFADRLLRVLMFDRVAPERLQTAHAAASDIAR